MINKKWGFNDFVVLASFRYCLGRRTYSVPICVEFLIENWDLISTNDRQLICNEISEAIDKDAAGSSFDVESWKGVLEHAKKVEHS